MDEAVKVNFGNPVSASGSAPGDVAPKGTPGTGEAICPQCKGSGKINDRACENCNGTGKVVEGVGGG
jgi:hypothetical protein